MQQRLLNEIDQARSKPGFSPPMLPGIAFTILLLALSFGSLAQARNELVNLTGVVRDRAGTFLPNNPVTVNGTSRGTVTNAKGEFSLQATRFDSIAFTSVGYVSQLQPVLDNRVFYVTL